MASLQDSTLAPLSPAIFYDRPVHRLSVEEYARMAELGFFGDHRVELLEGVIVEMTPIGPQHCYTASKLARILRTLIEPLTWHVEEGWPIGLSESRPQPDVVVLRGTMEDHATRVPAPAEVALIVEVSDSALAADRGQKSRLYAAAGIEQVWIVNLIDRQIEVFTDPTLDSQGVCEYRTRQEIKDEVALNLLGQRLGSVRLADILP